MLCEPLADFTDLQSGALLMSRLSIVRIGGKDVVVEVEPAPIGLPGNSEFAPEGAELTGIGDRARDAAAMIENSIAGVAAAALKALEHVAPDECSVEIGMTFKGEHSPIPVIVKVAGEASFKVTAKWTKK